ncbi:hypothetical protein F383_01342 [Gossypium arboreum]|uniref:Uncharacterized protein n=1 Tax=Gossypium arboreum TaxID=29729 RepID=A0A0B0P9F1_GOSAR|nr:hypothetical protein F383_01342 [Gossypium arboreum]
MMNLTSEMGQSASLE